MSSSYTASGYTLPTSMSMGMSATVVAPSGSSGPTLSYTSNVNVNCYTQASPGNLSITVSTNNAVKINSELTVTGRDIYSRNTPGVYAINLRPEPNQLYPLVSSAIKIWRLCITNNFESCYLVYPDWGFQLYDGENYTGTNSYIYFNTSDTPQVFGTKTQSVQASYCTFIYNTSNGQWVEATTSSIKIFYKGVEVISPLTTA